jgi:endonuclease III
MAPKDWKQVWDSIEKMRSEIIAPVDTMGCDKLFLQNSSPSEKRFQILISLLLSSQTKDEITAGAAKRLFSAASSPRAVISIDEREISKLIFPVGFYNRKATFIKKVSQALIDDHQGDVPKDVQAICKLPGIGPKMAYLAVNAAWGLCQGIGVDVHVHRISDRLGWTRNASTPEITRKQLEGWLPRENWSRINQLLVGFGQTICTAKNPKCSTCLALPFCSFGQTRVQKINR